MNRSAWGGHKVEHFPDLPEFIEVGDMGVKVAQISLDGPSEYAQAMQFLVYLPPGADGAGEQYSCVLTAPAGTNLLSGASLGPLDEYAYHDESLPYAEAGFVVVLYSIDGENLGDDESIDSVADVYEQFRKAGAGTLNGRNAFDFALAKLPMVDPDRIFAVGHSSAGTLALLMGSHEPRLRGVVAYAPCGDVEGNFSELLAEDGVSLILPGIKYFTKRSSPMTHVDKMKVPVFYFYARDDMRIAEEDAKAYINALRLHTSEVEVKRVSSGGHYDSMIEEGIPAGIEWMKGIE